MPYKMQNGICEICGKEFRRSANIDKPPRFCSADCNYAWRTGRRYPKYIVDERWYPIIEKTYRTYTHKGEIKALAKKIGVPRTKITDIAKSNGWIPATRVSDWARQWCQAENDIVIRNSAAHPITISRKLRDAGFDRTQAAVELQMKKLRARGNNTGITANELGAAMGVDAHVITNAIRSGKLKASARPGYERKDGKQVWYIRPERIKKWIVQYLPEIDIRRADKFWLVDILTGGMVIGEEDSGDGSNSERTAA